MSRKLLESTIELGDTAAPAPKGDYQILSDQRGAFADKFALERSVSGREAAAIVFGSGAVIVVPEGDRLKGTGRIVGAAVVPFQAGLQSRSAWALDDVNARAFNRGVLAGYFLVRGSLPKPNEPDSLAPLPAAVREFSRGKELDGYLRKALALAKEAFGPIERFEPEVHQDRETTDEWIVLRVVVREDRVNVSAARKKYTTEWVASVPAPQRYLIRLSPDIL